MNQHMPEVPPPSILTAVGKLFIRLFVGALCAVVLISLGLLSTAPYGGSSGESRLFALLVWVAGIMTPIWALSPFVRALRHRTDRRLPKRKSVPKAIEPGLGRVPVKPAAAPRLGIGGALMKLALRLVGGFGCVVALFALGTLFDANNALILIRDLLVWAAIVATPIWAFAPLVRAISQRRQRARETGL